MSDYSAANRQASLILKEFEVSPQTGLLSSQIEKNLISSGPNEIQDRGTTVLNIFSRQFKSPFIYLLIAASILAAILGEKIDALLILIFILVNLLLGFIQEYHSENAVKKLKRFMTPKARVLRDGRKQVIDAKGLVPGDILLLVPGDIIAADIRFLDCHYLEVDESILTGESKPVKKTALLIKKPVKEVFQATNLGFSNTTVVSGEGIGVVIATGRKSVLGEISKLVGEATRISTFEKEVSKFSRFVLWLIVITISCVFLLNVILKHETLNYLNLAIFSVALTVSVIPEALPMVITFSLSRGALRMAKNKVAVKRLSAIEDLGSIEVLCTDKTGTITENSLAVAESYSSSPESLFFFAGVSVLAFNPDGLEPTNCFDLAFWKKLSPKQKKEIKAYEKVEEISFDPQRRYDTVVSRKGDDLVLIVRGAPETVISLCPGLSTEEIRKAEKWLAEEGKLARRVLAVAKKSLKKKIDYSKLLNEEKELELLGFVSFVDPLKESTLGAVRLAKELGVKVKIITGDRPEVAGAVSTLIGLTNDSSKVMNGIDFNKMNQEEKEKCVEVYEVFARINPWQKYEIVKLLEKNHEVGFLGEGINDAPALKVANVALAVEGSSDVSKEAADIILLNKSLKVIIDGIKEGREVFANTTKYIVASLASNFGNFYAMAAVSLFIPSLPMLPIQILLLNLLSDFPMISIATDNVDQQELINPRNYKIKEIASMMTLFGLVSSFFDLLMFAVLYRISFLIFQTGWFMGSCLTELVFLFSVRTRFLFFKAKRPSLSILVLTIICFLLAIFLPMTKLGHETFHFVSLSLGQILIILAIVLAYFLTTESVKLIYYRFSGSH